MRACRTPPLLPLCRWVPFFLLACLAAGSAPAFADTPPQPELGALPPALDKAVPESVEDLRAIQQQVKKVLKKVLPCTVAVQIGAGQGSGVVVSEDGYVMTAGHVVGQPERNVTLIFPDGRKVRGKTLGANRAIDSGLVKITDPGKWPFVELGTSADIKPGQWCITVGHPGGFKAGRTPVVRVGRVLEQANSYLRTTCTLVGGDSGGPLFDLQGKVIGIHSRIGNMITANIHVPVDTYSNTWDRLAKGENWGGPFLGVQGDPDAPNCRLLHIIPGSPAEKAGLQENDVITRFGERKIETYDDLVSQIARRKPGQSVTLEVQRGDESLMIQVAIGKRDS